MLTSFSPQQGAHGSKLRVALIFILVSILSLVCVRPDIRLSGSSNLLDASPRPAAFVVSRSVHLLRTSSSHQVILAVYKKMQRELGPDAVFLAFDDSSATWPHSATIRMVETRPLQGAPHVLLLNRTECEGVVGSGALGECSMQQTRCKGLCVACGWQLNSAVDTDIKQGAEAVHCGLCMWTTQ